MSGAGPRPGAAPRPGADPRFGARARADQLLVERGLFESRARAREAIDAGLVTADGVPVAKASQAVLLSATLDGAAPHPYASRAGAKLAAALDAFGIDPEGLPCLDVGASTGGFTDALLARGAARVLAVDVGRGQLHPRLRADPRVASLEGTDARALDAAALARHLGGPPALVAVDVSFIGLALVLPPVLALAAPGAVLVALVKPQFEAGRAALDHRGVVRDPAKRAAAAAAAGALVADLGWAVLGTMESPLRGGDGNREWLLAARAPGGAVPGGAP